MWLAGPMGTIRLAKGPVVMQPPPVRPGMGTRDCQSAGKPEMSAM